VDLAEVPLVVILAGLAAYVVLGGADFGAGLWYVLLPGERHKDLREHTYHAMGPVWEANHVWLIFVLVVTWTAYPRVFGSITSTLYVPLFIAAIGIILRGATYALRGVVGSAREERFVGAIFGASSALTPFALATAIGGIASGRVPVGTGGGDTWTSWLNGTSLAIGALAVATSAYLAAVWLTADAARAGHAGVANAFRVRALAAGTVAGALALAGLIVLHEDARELYDGLSGGAGLAAVLVSAAAGVATMALVAGRRLEQARYSAAIAVAAIVGGWAAAQSPDLLPGLTIHQAAAGDATLVAVLVGVAFGALVLIPSLALLFGLVLRGRFDALPQELGSLDQAGRQRVVSAGPPGPERGRPSWLAAGAALLAVSGVGLTVISESGLPLAIGVICLLAAVAAASALLLPQVAEDQSRDAGEV
jgi:cytochrome bd ubiquinol oxidase subunit II